MTHRHVYDVGTSEEPASRPMRCVICGEFEAGGEPVVGTIDTTKMPYTVEPDDSSFCVNCGTGRMWDVIGPDGVALGMSFGIESDAEDLADNLSRAYLAGAQAAIKTLQKED
jgi:hypothetical protein